MKQASAWERERKRGDNQRASVRGSYKRGQKGLANLREGLGRFVGHLLRAKADPHKTGKVFRSLKKDKRLRSLVTMNIKRARDTTGRVGGIAGVLAGGAMSGSIVRGRISEADNAQR